MPEFARERVVDEITITPGRSHSLQFGAPTPGPLEVDLVVSPPPPSTIEVTIRDAAGNIVVSGPGDQKCQVDESRGGRETRGPWTLELRNRGEHTVVVSANLFFFGDRPILEKPIDLERLNRELDAFVDEAGPSRVVLTRRPVGRRLDPSTGELEDIVHGFLVLEPSQAWLLAYPSAGSIEVDLGEGVVVEETASRRLELRATTVDGQLAFAIRASFPPGRGSIDVLRLATAHLGLAARLLALPIDPPVEIGTDVASERPVLSLDELEIEAMLVLETRPGMQPRLRLWIQPRVRVAGEGPDGSFFSFGAEALGSYLLSLARSALLELPESATVASDLLAWLLGDRGREIVGTRQELALRYAGDPSRAV